MPRMKLALLAWLLATSTIARAGDGLLGCYVVQVAPAYGTVEAKSIQLTNEPVTYPWTTKGAMRVVPAVSTGKFDYSSAYWERSGDQIVITFTEDGLYGAELHARQTKNGLQGTIERFSDVGPPTLTDARSIALIRRPCGSFH